MAANPITTEERYVSFFRILGIVEGTVMNAVDYWRFFLETGAPEYYLMYQNALKMEEAHVPDDSGHCPAGHGLQ